MSFYIGKSLKKPFTFVSLYQPKNRCKTNVETCASTQTKEERSMHTIIKIWLYVSRMRYGYIVIEVDHSENSPSEE